MKRMRIVISIGTGLIVVALFAISIVQYVHQINIELGIALVEGSKRLAEAFETINQECGILGFDHQQNNINFLNIRSLSGSEVGPMNLKNPERWNGPYICDNPTVHSKEFMIVRTNDGYFITPGNGVKLPSGKRVGRDIMFNQTADIPALLASGELSYRGEPFVYKIKIR